ncbi:MAG: hypothetical protein IJB26_05725 [Clostridia bacterium]|nr:hypothetical protein [Clostridia bacterium]
MNKSKVSTQEKVMLPLRLPPDVYQKVRRKVNTKKDDIRGYSINEYLTELVMKDLGVKK